MIANSEVDSNLYYATKFLAPDPFIFLQTGGRKTLVMSDLELDRAKAHAHVDTVLSYSQYEQRLKTGGSAAPSLIDVVEAVLKEQGVKQFLVPETFGLRHADGLRSKGFVVTAKPDPIFEERVIKTEEEVQAISQAQRAVEAAVEAAIEVLREATVKKDVLHWKSGVLTSEALKKVVNVKLMELDCVAQHTIIAGGRMHRRPRGRCADATPIGRATVLRRLRIPAPGLPGGDRSRPRRPGGRPSRGRPARRRR